MLSIPDMGKVVALYPSVQTGAALHSASYSTATADFLHQVPTDGSRKLIDLTLICRMCGVKPKIPVHHRPSRCGGQVNRDELLGRSQYSEGPATGHLDTGFSWFPCA